LPHRIPLPVRCPKLRFSHLETLEGFLGSIRMCTCLQLGGRSRLAGLSSGTSWIRRALLSVLPLRAPAFHRLGSGWSSLCNRVAQTWGSVRYSTQKLMPTMKVALRGWTRVTAEYKWRVESVAHTLILGEHKTNINSPDTLRFLAIGATLITRSGDPPKRRASYSACSPSSVDAALRRACVLHLLIGHTRLSFHQQVGICSTSSSPYVYQADSG
jgi:hypothetical protein